MNDFLLHWGEPLLSTSFSHELYHYRGPETGRSHTLSLMDSPLD